MSDTDLDLTVSSSFLEDPKVVEFEDEDPSVDGGQVRKKKHGGGFQTLGLFGPLFRAIQKKGYRVPTPVQRKVLPLALAGRDVVAMARTGSGKTAAFLIPLIQGLVAHQSMGPIRAIILSPTRELAMQTLQFAKDLGKFTDLRFCLLLGGVSMEAQFTDLSKHPDLIIATPGRLVHHIAEMELSLTQVRFLVFDEADRLFEMGFAPQMREILSKVTNPNRQTLLLSATLPENVAEFARAGLSNPAIVRLDVESKLSEKLQLQFFTVRKEEKMAGLLYLMREVLKPEDRTIVFTATRHHVEFLQQLLLANGYAVAYVYGEMDQTARNIAVAKFRNGTCKVLVVTDVAARGIDIPLLDNVINYDFPSKPKLFIHRAGRVARAGRSGLALSLVSPKELPYMVDLHLFLGQRLTNGNESSKDAISTYGNIPQLLIDYEQERVKKFIDQSADLTSLLPVLSNAYKLYYKTQSGASKESVKRAATMDKTKIHPWLLEQQENQSEVVQHNDMLNSLSSFRPKQTVFEMSSRGGDSHTNMRVKRQTHDSVIQSIAYENQDDVQAEVQEEVKDVVPTHSKKRKTMVSSSRDAEFYLDATPSFKRAQIESRMSIHDKTRTSTLAESTFDLTPDESSAIMKKKRAMRWDVRKKKYVQVTQNEDSLSNLRKQKNESGQVIKPGKKGQVQVGTLYEAWKKKQRTPIGETSGRVSTTTLPAYGKGRHSKVAVNKNTAQQELKSEEQIRLQRSKRHSKERRRNPEANRKAKEVYVRKKLARLSHLKSAPAKSKRIGRR